MRPQRERRRYFRMRFMCICSSQEVNPAIDELRGALRRQARPSCKEFSRYADLVPLGILDEGRQPPGTARR
jgi:hypothetical protein